MNSKLLWITIAVGAVILLLLLLQTVRTERNKRRARDFFDQGVAAMNVGDVKQAIVRFSQAIDVDPTFAQAYFNRAFIYGETGQFDMAKGEFIQPNISSCKT